MDPDPLPPFPSGPQEIPFIGHFVEEALLKAGAAFHPQSVYTGSLGTNFLSLYGSIRKETKLSLVRRKEGIWNLIWNLVMPDI